LRADLCAVLTYEVKGDILGNGDWQHRATYRCRDALSLVQNISQGGWGEQRARANAVLRRAAEVIALGIDGANTEECLWFAHLARSMPTALLRESDVFALLHKRRQELISAGDRERLWGSPNLGYTAAMHNALHAKELLDPVGGSYDWGLLKEFSLRHAKREPSALSSNIARKIQSPSPTESLVAPWDRLMEGILTGR
jgi:hypothetical protein